MRWKPAAAIVVMYVFIAVVAFAIGFFTDHVNLFVYPAELGNPEPVSLALQVSAGLIIGLAGASAAMLLASRSRWFALVDEFLASLVSQFSTAESVIMVVFSAVAEEMLFRGALQPAVGLFGQALLFAFLHVGSLRLAPFLLPWTLSAFIAGVVLGLLFSTTGTLLAPIIAHGVINAVGIYRMQKMARQGKVRTPDEILREWTGQE